MRANRGHLPLFVLFLFLFGVLGAQAQPAGLFLRSTVRKGLINVEHDRKVLNQRNVIADLTVLRGRSNETLRFPAFGGEVILVRDHQELPRKNTLIWLGHVKAQPKSFAVFCVVNNVVVGNVTMQGRETWEFYQLRYLGNRVHALRQIDQSGYPPADRRGRLLTDDEEPSRDERAPRCVTDPASDIDVLVSYTPAALAAAGGRDGIEATIYLAVSETNLSYENSAITQRLRLTHMEEVAYVEGGDVELDRNRLKRPADGYMDNVLSIRNTYSADIVVLLVEYPSSYPYCGIAYVMYDVSNSQESKAYAVVLRDCAIGIYAFAHETGHIMGARHDWYVDDADKAPYVYNHGYVFKSSRADKKGWRTIMSYDDDCKDSGIPPRNCPLIPYWSNPGITYPPGDPMGVPSGGEEQSDNHKTLNNTALTVANFRCSSRGVDNVWMRDSWSDTGQEPDSHTVSEEMWRSPDIWVRRLQDLTLTKQYEHQSPLAGTQNWLYVELRNGGDDTSGHVELYWAKDSASLAWPGDWTLLATVPVSSFMKNSVRVVEAGWTPPSAGHYPLVARWVSATDPMASPETSDVERNVRGNNNIVWRNVVATVD